MLMFRSIIKYFGSALLGIFPFVALHAQVNLPAVFSNNMVLQREKPVAIWGLASVGESVTVNFANQSKTATANSVGKWQIMLDAMPANDNPNTLTITGKNRLQLTNILVGDVWLC